MTLPMFKNSSGDPDFLLTASVLALATVLVKFLLGGAVVAGHQLGPTPDASIIGAILLPTFGAYTTKRVVQLKNPGPGYPPEPSGG